jgi:hypothetical protein
MVLFDSGSRESIGVLEGDDRLSQLLRWGFGVSRYEIELAKPRDLATVGINFRGGPIVPWFATKARRGLPRGIYRYDRLLHAAFRAGNGPDIPAGDLWLILTTDMGMPTPIAAMTDVLGRLAVLPEWIGVDLLADRAVSPGIGSMLSAERARPLRIVRLRSTSDPGSSCNRQLPTPHDLDSVSPPLKLSEGSAHRSTVAYVLSRALKGAVRSGARPGVRCYILINKIAELDAGAYRLSIPDSAMTPIWRGDVSRVLEQSSIDPFGPAAHANLVLLLAGVVGGDRDNAWWNSELSHETASIAQHVVLVAESVGLHGAIRDDFDPAIVQAALGLFGTDEVPFVEVVITVRHCDPVLRVPARW